MNRFLLTLLAAAAIAPSALAAEPAAAGSTAPASPRYEGPFSQIAIGGNVSPLGPGAQITTNIVPHLNLRLAGNGFSYATTFTTNGFNANAKLNLASARIAADYYPFHLGFRISPGVMVVNNNKVTATALAAPGTSITLNGDTFYSDTTNSVTGSTPLHASALLGLHATRPAFTITTGWGNELGRSHFSVPFEIGAAFTGAPTVNVNLAGWACYDSTLIECNNIADTSNPIGAQVQSDLTAQVAKWKKDLNPLQVYPIVSVGVAYRFSLR